MPTTILQNGTTLANGTIATGNTDEIADNRFAVFIGQLDNLGTLFDDSVGNTTDIDIGDGSGVSSTTTLTGDGVVLLSDAGNNRLIAVAGGASLINVNNRIEGSGQIGAGTALAFTNLAGGTIAATGTNAALTINIGGGQTLTNQGLIESLGNAGAAVQGLAINDTLVDNVGGTIAAFGAGAGVTLRVSHLIGGVLESSGGGVIYASGGTEFDGTTIAPTIASASTLEVTDNTNIDIVGTLNNQGTLFDNSVGNPTDIDIGDASGTSATTLTGGGVILLSDNANNRIPAVASGDSLTNVNNLIEGSGQIGVNGLTIINLAAGTIDATGPAGLLITSATTITNVAGGLLLAAGAPISLSASAAVAGGTLASSAGGQFYSSTAALDGSAAPLTITSATTFNVDDNTALSLLGTIDLLGTLADNSAGNLTDLVIASPTVTLTGGGLVLLDDQHNNRIYGATQTDQTLVNLGDVIAGAGQIGINSGANPLTLINTATGTIDASATNNALIIQPGFPTVANFGLIEATGAAGLVITAATTIDNLGAGRLLAAGSSITINSGADIFGGTLASTGGGRFYTNTATLDGSASPLTIGNQAVVNVDDNTGLALLGTIDLLGTLSSNSAGNLTDLIISSPTLTLTGGGQVLLDNQNNNRIYGAAGTLDTLINQGDVIAGAGQLGINSAGNPLALINTATGTIDANGTTDGLVIEPGGHAVLNYGLIEATTAPGLLITAGATIDNLGTGFLLSDASNIIISNNADIVGGTLASSGGGFYGIINATLDGSTTPLTIGPGVFVNHNDNSNLTLLGKIDLLGTLLSNSAGNLTDQILATPTVTLTGGGLLMLDDQHNNRIYGASGTLDTLVNQGDVIAGAGQLGVNSGGNPLALVNTATGTIDANATNNALEIETGGPAVANSGLIEATGAGGLVVFNSTIDNIGTGFLLAAGSSITINTNSDIVGGTLASSGGGLFSISNSTLDGSATPLTIATGALVSHTDNNDLTLFGTIDLLGTLANNSAGNLTDILLATPVVTLTGGGLLLLDNQLNNRIYGDSATDETLVNQGDVIAGAGELGVNSAGNPLALVNLAGATIDATDGTALVIQTGGPTVLNAGLLEATGAGGLDVFASVVDNLPGGTIAAGPNSEVFFRSDAGATNLAAGTLTGGEWLSQPGGAIVFQAGTSITTDAADIVLVGSGSALSSNGTLLDQSLTAITSAGTLELLGGRNWNGSKALSDAGLLQLGGGTFDAPSLAVTSSGHVLGFGTIVDGGNNAGLIEAQGGTLVLKAPPTGSGTLQTDSFATLELGGPSSQTVMFDPGHATLRLDSPSSYTGTLTDIIATDTLDLAGLTATNATSAGTTLTVTLAGNTTQTYTLAAPLTGIREAATADGSGGTDIVFYREASAGTLTPASINFGQAHVGGTLTQSETLTNTATNDGYSEKLDAGFTGATGPISGNGTVSLLAPGATNTSGLSVTLSTATAGLISAAATLTPQSDGTGTDGQPPVNLAPQTISATGTIFNYATPALTPGTIAFGIVHVGDTLTHGVTLSNTAPVGSFSEKLDAGFITNPGNVTGTGSFIGLAAGPTPNTSLSVALNTATAGTISGTATLALTSDGAGIDNLGTTPLANQTIALNATIDHYATAALQEISGGGTTSGTAGNLTINLGTLGENPAVFHTLDIGVANIAVGLADALFGSITGTAAPDFTDLLLPTFGTVAGGAVANVGSVVVAQGTIGVYSETLTISTTGTNASGYAGTLGTETLIIEADVVACFAAGTRIATPAGDVPVETLRAGDLVLTAAGAAVPALWIGRRTLAPREHLDPSRAQPVRIAAAAFGGGLPAADLRLSPEHALYIRGVFIPVRHLINGTSIVQEDVAEVTYYHVALATHDVLLANRLPSESWLDTGIHRGFENPPPPTLRATLPRQASAPVIESGPVLDLVRRDLAARAIRLGFRPPRVFDVELTQPGVTRVTVPAGTEWVQLRSPAGMVEGDRRRLGVAIGRLRLDSRTLELNDPRLHRGFHPIDRQDRATWRWTEGDAFIKLAASRDHHVEIEVVATSVAPAEIAA
jgi:hypothetical protein